MNENEIKEGSIYKSGEKCPRCGVEGEPLLAVSRRIKEISICSKCGAEESVFDFKIHQSRNMVGADVFKEEIDKAVEDEKAWLNKEER